MREVCWAFRLNKLPACGLESFTAVVERSSYGNILLYTLATFLSRPISFSQHRNGVRRGYVPAKLKSSPRRTYSVHQLSPSNRGSNVTLLDMDRLASPPPGVMGNVAPPKKTQCSEFFYIYHVKHHRLVHCSQIFWWHSDEHKSCSAHAPMHALHIVRKSHETFINNLNDAMDYTSRRSPCQRQQRTLNVRTKSQFFLRMGTPRTLRAPMFYSLSSAVQRGRHGKYLSFSEILRLTGHRGNRPTWICKQLLTTYSSCSA